MATKSRMWTLTRRRSTVELARITLRTQRFNTPSVPYTPFPSSVSNTSQWTGSTTAFSYRPKLRVREDPTRPPKVKSIVAFDYLAEKKEATIEDAYDALRFERSRLERLPLPERRKAAAEAGADRILGFLWDKREEISDSEISAALSGDLCWFLHVQGLDEFVWKWFEVERSMSEDIVSAGDPNTVQWPWHHRLVAGILLANYHWAADGKPDSTLRLFFEIVAKLRAIHGRELFVSSLIGPITCMGKILQNNTVQPCEARLFRRFLGAQNIVTAPSHQPLQTAETQLYHPVDPDPLPYLRLLRKFYLENDITIFRAHRPAALNNFGNRIFRTAFILRLQGQQEEADWCESIVEQHFDPVWRARPTILRALNRDPKLQHLKRGKADEQKVRFVKSTSHGVNETRRW